MEFENDIDALFATYQSLLPMAEEDEARLWEKFRLEWNYNSNSIEGNTLTMSETRALLLYGVEPHRIRKDIMQMQSHNKAIDFLLEISKSDTPITEVDIRALNEKSLGANYWIEAITLDRNVTKKEIKPGVYKQTPNIVLKTDGDTHEYASPEEVPARMQATVQNIRKYLKKQDKPLFEFLAELHQDFIQTHPFDDGNGRVVRLLINYVCLKLGWPPVIIKFEKRPDYIASLESWNAGEKKHLIKLMRDELIWSLNKSIKAARGEPIDDPDDADKEFDIFVREASPAADKYISDIEKKRKNAEACFRDVSLNLLPKMRKLSKLFQKYIENPAFENDNGENVFLGGIQADNSRVQVFMLDKFKSENSKFMVKLKVEFYPTIPSVTADVEVWRNSSMSTRRLIHELNLPHQNGQFSFPDERFENYRGDYAKEFSSVIARAILREVKLFSNEKTAL